MTPQISINNDISRLLNQVLELAVNYLSELDRRSTITDHELNQHQLPESGLGDDAALDLFCKQLEPLMVASSGPRYWGFVTGGSTPAAIAGDWLAAIYDQNPQGTTGSGDRSAIIELETIRLLLRLFELPDDFSGGFVTGATMSNFTCMAVARQWLGRQLNQDIARDGMQGHYKILTATPHSSSLKSIAMLGFGSNNFQKVEVLPGNREAMDISKLEKAIKALDGKPFILISSAGTVNTVDFDDMQAIAALKNQYSFWWHIDAAFGAFAVLSEEHRELFLGWERADSITIDCHKWMNVPYDSAIFLVRKEHSQLEVESFQNSNAPYLADPLANFNYLNFLPDNSRRLKALPAWFSLMAYGRDGYKKIVENDILLARRFGSLLQDDERFELLAPVRVNTVCFTLAGKEGQEQVTSFLEQLNATGLVFMTPTIYNGRKGIRAAFVNWRTTKEDVDMVWGKMVELVGML
ncbi:MAG TPA: pyridoxal-dependent decarboxylase [Flavitalea sp.]|nr:pyridoxal-dependent decarboxylase [Flavitalea sp.]